MLWLRGQFLKHVDEVLKKYGQSKFLEGSDYRSANGRSFFESYSSGTCNMRVMHNEYAVDCTTLSRNVPNLIPEPNP